VDAYKYWSSLGVSYDGQTLFALAIYDSAYLSTDQGANWHTVGGFGGASLLTHYARLSGDGQAILIPIWNGRVWLSLNGGVSFEEYRPDGMDHSYNWCAAAIDYDGSAWIVGAYGGRGYVTTNSGASFIEAKPEGDADILWNRASINSTGSLIAVSIEGRYLYYSTDGGATWGRWTPLAGLQNYSNIAMSASGRYVIAEVMPGKVYWSSNFGSSWVVETPPGDALNRNWYGAAVNWEGTRYVVCGEYDGSTPNERVYLGVAH